MMSCIPYDLHDSFICNADPFVDVIPWWRTVILHSHCFLVLFINVLLALLITGWHKEMHLLGVCSILIIRFWNVAWKSSNIGSMTPYVASPMNGLKTLYFHISISHPSSMLSLCMHINLEGQTLLLNNPPSRLAFEHKHESKKLAWCCHCHNMGSSFVSLINVFMWTVIILIKLWSIPINGDSKILKATWLKKFWMYCF